MQTRQYSFVSWGNELSFTGPAKIADVEKFTGENAVIEAFFTAYGYERNRPLYLNTVARIEEHTSQKRKQHTRQGKKDAEKEIVVYDETEKDFADRMVEEKLISEEEVLTYLKEENEKLGEWTWKPTTDRKPAAKFYTVAQAIVDRVTNQTVLPNGATATAELYIAGFENKLGVSFQSAFGEWNLDNVARAVKAVEEANQRKLSDSILE